MCFPAVPHRSLARTVDLQKYNVRFQLLSRTLQSQSRSVTPTGCPAGEFAVPPRFPGVPTGLRRRDWAGVLRPDPRTRFPPGRPRPWPCRTGTGHGAGGPDPPWGRPEPRRLRDPAPARPPGSAGPTARRRRVPARRLRGRRGGGTPGRPCRSGRARGAGPDALRRPSHHGSGACRRRRGVGGPRGRPVGNSPPRPVGAGDGDVAVVGRRRPPPGPGPGRAGHGAGADQLCPRRPGAVGGDDRRGPRGGAGRRQEDPRLHGPGRTETADGARGPRRAGGPGAGHPGPGGRGGRPRPDLVHPPGSRSGRHARAAPDAWPPPAVRPGGPSVARGAGPGGRDRGPRRTTAQAAVHRGVRGGRRRAGGGRPQRVGARRDADRLRLRAHPGPRHLRCAAPDPRPPRGPDPAHRGHGTGGAAAVRRGDPTGVRAPRGRGGPVGGGPRPVRRRSHLRGGRRDLDAGSGGWALGPAGGGALPRGRPMAGVGEGHQRPRAGGGHPRTDRRGPAVPALRVPARGHRGAVLRADEGGRHRRGGGAPGGARGIGAGAGVAAQGGDQAGLPRAAGPGAGGHAPRPDRGDDRAR